MCINLTDSIIDSYTSSVVTFYIECLHVVDNICIANYCKQKLSRLNTWFYTKNAQGVTSLNDAQSGLNIINLRRSLV